VPPPRRTQVFYFRDAAGVEPAADFINEVKRRKPKAAAKIFSYLTILKNHNPGGQSLPSNYVKALRDGILELRPEWGGTEYRIFFAWLSGGRAILLHGCQKRVKESTEDREIDRALRNLAEHRDREEPTQ